QFCKHPAHWIPRFGKPHRTYCWANTLPQTKPPSCPVGPMSRSAPTKTPPDSPTARQPASYPSSPSAEPTNSPTCLNTVPLATDSNPTSPTKPAPPRPSAVILSEPNQERRTTNQEPFPDFRIRHVPRPLYPPDPLCTF